MADILATVTNSILFGQDVHYCYETIIEHYGTIDDADIYFCSRLNSDVWECANRSDKRKALLMATRAIDRLNFKGTKASESQCLEFPRGTANVPANIKIACYEEAYELLDGAEHQREQINLSVVSEGIVSTRTTYNRNFVPDNVKAGILSFRAWTYLQPYLRDHNSVNICRV